MSHAIDTDAMMRSLDSALVEHQRAESPRRATGGRRAVAPGMITELAEPVLLRVMSANGNLELGRTAATASKFRTLIAQHSELLVRLSEGAESVLASVEDKVELAKIEHALSTPAPPPRAVLDRMKFLITLRVEGQIVLRAWLPPPTVGDCECPWEPALSFDFERSVPRPEKLGKLSCIVGVLNTRTKKVAVLNESSFSHEEEGPTLEFEPGRDSVLTPATLNLGLKHFDDQRPKDGAEYGDHMWPLTEVRLLLEDEDSDDDSEKTAGDDDDDDNLQIRGVDILFYWESIGSFCGGDSCARPGEPAMFLRYLAWK